MLAIWRQAKADLLTRCVQSVLILLTVIGAATLITIGLTTTSSARRPFERVFEAANGAHIWITLRGSEEDIRDAAAKLAALPGVEASTDIRRITIGELFMSGEHETLYLEGISLELPQVARPVMTAGRYFTTGDTNAIILDKNMARERNVSVGDTVEFVTPQGRKPLCVVGLAINVEKGVYSPSGGRSLNFVPESLLPTLMQKLTQDYGQVGLRLYDEDSVRTIWQAAQVAAGNVTYDYKDWRDVRDSTGNLARINTVFLLVFGLFAMLSAGFIIAATIGGTVLAQYRAIGLLKAIGFTGRQITLLFVAENMLLGLLGGVIGLIGGLAASPLALQPIAEALNAPPVPVIDPVVVGLVLCGTVGLTAIFSLWPARQASRVPPVQAIRFGPEMPQVWPSQLAQLAARLKLSAVLVLGLKDTYARPGRAVLTTLSVGLGVLAVVFALGLTVTLDRFIADPSLFGVVYDASFRRNHDYVSDAEARSAMAARPEFRAFYGDVWNTVRLSGTETTFFAGFLEGDLEAFDFDITAGRMFQSPNEAVAGEGLLRMAGKSVGDELSVGTASGPLVLKIVGVTSLTGLDNSSRIFLASMDTLRQLGSDAEPLIYRVNLREDSDAKTFVMAVEKDTDGLLLGEVVDHTPPREILLLRPVVAGLALALSLIALMSVLNSVLMGVRERVRDLATFKAVGLTPGQVMSTVLVGAVALALVAIVVGLPVGVVFTYGAFVGLARWQGFTRAMPFVVNWLGLALVPFGMLLVAALGAALPARWAARIKVVDLLRYE